MISSDRQVTVYDARYKCIGDASYFCGIVVETEHFILKTKNEVLIGEDGKVIDINSHNDIDLIKLENPNIIYYNE